MRQVSTRWHVLALGALLTTSLGALAADAKGVAYVTNQNAGVSVIDLDSLEVTDSIDIEGKEPRGLGVTADGKRLITANRDGGDISVIDTSTRKVLRHIKIGKNPEFVRVRGDLAFVSFEPSAKGGPPPKPGAEPKKEAGAAAKEGGAHDDDDNKEPARIAVVDLNKGKVLRTIKGGPETEGIEFAADGKSIIVTNEADNTITVHDIASGKLLKTIPTSTYGNRPRGIKISPDKSFYVATLEFGNSFLVLDSKLNPVKTVPTGQSPYGITFDRSGDRIFVAAARDKVLDVFDAKSFEKIKSVPIGDRCWHFSFTPDDAHILVACGKSNDVLVVDATSYEVTKHITGKELPWGIVTYPKSVGSLDQP